MQILLWRAGGENLANIRSSKTLVTPPSIDTDLKNLYYFIFILTSVLILFLKKLYFTFIFYLLLFIYFLGFSSCVVLFLCFCSISLYGPFMCCYIMCVSVCRPIVYRYSLLYNCTSLYICMRLPVGVIINDDRLLKGDSQVCSAVSADLRPNGCLVS